MKTVEVSKEVAEEVHRLNVRILELEAKCRRYEEAMVEVRDEIGSCMKRDAESFMRMTLEQVEAWGIARHNQTHGYVLDRIRGVLGV